MHKQSNEQSSMNVGSNGAGSGDKEVQARAYDQAAVQERMTKLRDKVKTQKEAEKTREAELAKVEIQAADVAVLADAMCCTAAVAERRLRERHGDFAQVLRDQLAGKFSGAGSK